MYEDKTLRCKDCGNEFVFTAGEQEFYAEKGFMNEPQRCKDCRVARKNAIRANREMHTSTRPCVRTVAAKQRSHLSRWKARITIAANVLLRGKKQKKRHKLSNMYCYSAPRGALFSLRNS